MFSVARVKFPDDVSSQRPRGREARPELSIHRAYGEAVRAILASGPSARLFFLLRLWSMLGAGDGVEPLATSGSPAEASAGSEAHDRRLRGSSKIRRRRRSGPRGKVVSAQFSVENAPLFLTEH